MLRVGNETWHTAYSRREEDHVSRTEGVLEKKMQTQIRAIKARRCVNRKEVVVKVK